MVNRSALLGAFLLNPEDLRAWSLLPPHRYEVRRKLMLSFRSSQLVSVAVLSSDSFE